MRGCHAGGRWSFSVVGGVFGGARALPRWGALVFASGHALPTHIPTHTHAQTQRPKSYKAPPSGQGPLKLQSAPEQPPTTEKDH